MILTLILLPLVAGIFIAMLPHRAEVTARLGAAATAAVSLLLTVMAQSAPDERHVWLMRPFVANAHLAMGSGLSYWLVLLIGVVTLSAVIIARVPRLPQFLGLVLALQATMTGVFVARDLLVFALFWDLMLLPVFWVLVGWTGHTTAAWRYLLYNVAGGLCLLLAVAAFGIDYGTTDVIGHQFFHPLGAVWGAWIFAGFAIAFLVKTPAWPLHTWMPETYAELPAPMAALVSAVQSKAGLYGFIVIGMPFFAAQMSAATPLLTALGIVGLIYGAFMALIQQDMKRVVAYSSLSHLGLILIALMSGNAIAIGGAILYLIGHGLFSAALFIVLGYVEVREDNRSIERLGGLAQRNPRLAGAFIFAALAALGLPGLVGFAGELVILTGLFRNGEILISLLALIPIVLAAAYMLRLFQGVMQGPQIDDLPQRVDLRPLEILALVPLGIGIILLGLAPRTLLESPEALQHAQPVMVDFSQIPLHPTLRMARVHDATREGELR